MSKEIFVAFATQKGGIGKTSVTVLVASYLHYVKGYNVAIVDCDYPQNSIMDIREREIKLIDEDTYFDGNELQRELMKAVQKLPEKQRIVFNMRYFDEMKYEDMAEILKTSAGSLKASYHHAYVKIKSELEKKF